MASRAAVMVAVAPAGHARLRKAATIITSVSQNRDVLLIVSVKSVGETIAAGPAAPVPRVVAVNSTIPVRTPVDVHRIVRVCSAAAMAVEVRVAAVVLARVATRVASVSTLVDVLHSVLERNVAVMVAVVRAVPVQRVTCVTGLLNA